MTRPKPAGWFPDEITVNVVQKIDESQMAELRTALSGLDMALSSVNRSLGKKVDHVVDVLTAKDAAEIEEIRAKYAEQRAKIEAAIEEHK